MEKIKRNKNKKLFFEIIKIKTKNLDKKPNKGGSSANVNINKTKKMVIKGKLPKNFNSFKVFKYFMSKIKNIKKMLIKIKI